MRVGQPQWCKTFPAPWAAPLASLGESNRSNKKDLQSFFHVNSCRYQQQQQELTAAGKGAPNRSFLEELRRAGIREEQRLAAGGGAGWDCKLQNGMDCVIVLDFISQTSTSAVPSSAFLPHSATVDEGFLQGWPQSHSAHGGVKMHPIAVEYSAYYIYYCIYFITILRNKDSLFILRHSHQQIAHFRLRNATLSGKTHSYMLERLPAADLGKQQLLPIYGNISAQILV
jgi:hypothetical protein